MLEYEYTLERKRVNRQRELKLNKTNDRDYASKINILWIVIKRILQLWDRTMNKYRYDLEMWKQYLCFCY